MTWTRLGSRVKDAARRLAEIKGITLSEYIRELVVDDLDARTIFSSELKAQIAGAAENDEATTIAHEAGENLREASRS